MLRTPRAGPIFSWEAYHRTLKGPRNEGKMAITPSASFSELQQFVLANAKYTGVKIGSGSYGAILEVEANGIICAGKKIHDSLADPHISGTQYIVERYVKECHLLSSLRHPNVVQFMGVCLLSEERLPVLVMEYLPSDLHDTLAKYSDIPLFVKRSILHDVTRGLVYLHAQKPPIIHRDLTAKNVLLNSAMVAKIADFGVSRRIIGEHITFQSATLTRVPGCDTYMPPEAFDKNPIYDAKLDMFSFGHLILYTLAQAVPVLLHPKSVSPKTTNFEVERRKPILSLLSDQLGQDHPVLTIATRCLSDNPRDRPTSMEVLQLFDELVKVDASSEGCIGQIDVLRMLSELHTKEMTIQVLEARVQKLEAAGDNTSNKMPQVREVFLHFTCIYK